MSGLSGMVQRPIPMPLSFLFLTFFAPPFLPPPRPCHVFLICHFFFSSFFHLSFFLLLFVCTLVFFSRPRSLLLLSPLHIPILSLLCSSSLLPFNSPIHRQHTHFHHRRYHHHDLFPLFATKHHYHASPRPITTHSTTTTFHPQPRPRHPRHFQTFTHPNTSTPFQASKHFSLNHHNHHHRHPL